MPGRTVRVLLDARKLGHGGIGTYISTLMGGLLSRGDVALTALVGDRSQIAPQWAGSVDVLVDRAAPYSIDEAFKLARRIDFSRFDVFHEPHYTLPFGVPIPSVITVHDLIHIKAPPAFFHPWIAAPWIRSSVSRASRVVTVSEATAADLRALVRRDHHAKIAVVPNAIDPAFLEPSSNGDANSPAAAHGSYFFALLSTDKPHKGLIDLLEAFRAMKNRGVRLVIAGQGTAGTGRFVFQTSIRKLGLENAVTLLGAVSKDELRKLYRDAVAVVVPSLLEGFGLAVIEAQAHGTKVIARPVPAIKEILTAHDVLCADFSVAALAAAMDKVSADAKQPLPADEMRRHLDRFSCEKVAATITEVYRGMTEEAK